MKIALIVPGGVDRSGDRRVIPALLALLKRLGARHDVHVYALRQEPVPGYWPLLGVQVHNIGGRSARWGLLRAVATIRAEHRVAPFDLLHAIWSGHCGMVAVSAARLLGVPSAVHVAGGELVALPVIHYGGRLTWRGRLREALVLRGATRVTAASEPMLAQLAKLGSTAQRLPLGVDLETWPSRPPQRRDTNAPLRLIHVASLNRVKDQATLLRAVALLARRGIDFHLDIVGEDTLGEEMQIMARQLDLASQTTFHGFLTHTQLRPLLAQAHVHLVTSMHEAGPLALLEAATLGVPSVGTRVGHLAEWAPHAALAVEVGDAPALCEAIERVGRDEDFRLRLAHEANRRAIREDADHTFTLVEALYGALTAGGV
ncbi:MAG TPA: glycosyltransferase family 4 protein [Burkholderiaceae bacterium]|nr:glycosyltransferase family 4 protein [Burkholderiaceae bacterium]